jgi:hypothetical protein
MFRLQLRGNIIYTKLAFLVKFDCSSTYSVIHEVNFNNNVAIYYPFCVAENDYLFHPLFFASYSK